MSNTRNELGKMTSFLVSHTRTYEHANACNCSNPHVTCYVAANDSGRIVQTSHLARMTASDRGKTVLDLRWALVTV